MGRRPELKTSLRKAMVLRGMDASQLAVATGIPVSTLQLVAGGFQKMRPDRVAKVAEALNVTPEELSDVTGSRSGGSTDHLAPKKETPKPEAAPAPKPEEQKANLLDIVRKLTKEVEKLWLYYHNANRRLMALEAEIRELKEGK